MSSHTSSTSNRYKADETALELFQRLRPNPTFSLRLNGEGSSETLSFRENVEILTNPTDLPELVLFAAEEFAGQHPDGVIIHISTGNNMFRSLLQSRMDISQHALFHMHQQDRVKEFTIHNILQLYAIAELLRTSIQQEKVLLLCEGLTTVFLAQKSCQGSILPTSLITSTLKAFTQLCQFHTVLTLWVNSAHVKYGGGLREGNSRDPLTILWKQKIHKVFYFHPTR